MFPNDVGSDRPGYATATAIVSLVNIQTNVCAIVFHDLPSLIVALCLTCNLEA